MQKKRILFVDDDANILGGIANVLHRERERWDMVFALGGEAALVEVRTSGPFDVVISDMRMPVLDGATLLRVIADESPATVRILLSGGDGAVSPDYHEVLEKPCSSTSLRAANERAVAR